MDVSGKCVGRVFEVDVSGKYVGRVFEVDVSGKYKCLRWMFQVNV